MEKAAAYSNGAARRIHENPLEMGLPHLYTKTGLLRVAPAVLKLML